MSTFLAACINPDASLADALRVIDETSLGVVLICDENQRLVGIATDGDIRRALLEGHGIDSSIRIATNASPTTARLGAPRESLLGTMRAATLHHLPIVDETGVLVDLVTLDQLIGATKRSNWAVLIAGGEGTRLRPLTEHTPKPLLAVAGQPILEMAVERFASQGFQNVFVSVNYKAEMIRAQIGDGDRWGISIDYLKEDQPLGTAGALSLLPAQPDEPFVVMNGDIITNADFDRMLRFHQKRNAVMTVAVRNHVTTLPYGAVEVDIDSIVSITEKPNLLNLINTGIYVLSPEALEYVPDNEPLGMTTLIERLLSANLPVAAHTLDEYWIDIGHPSDLERAEQEWVQKS